MDSLTSSTTSEGEQVHYRWRNGEEEHLCLSMRGLVQAQNSALAMLVLKTLNLFDQAMLPAIESNQIPGRFQQLSKDPCLYVDGAHTTRSLQALLSSFSSLHPSKENTVIFGALEDKDHAHMLSLLLDYFQRIIISRPGTFKKSDINHLHEFLLALAAKREKQYEILLIEDNLSALKEAFSRTAKEGAILTCGSFYLAGGIASAYEQVRSSHESQLA
jgi:dihydrofolate synthase/folylpolyglutamate synthase